MNTITLRTLNQYMGIICLTQSYYTIGFATENAVTKGLKRVKFVQVRSGKG